MRIPKQTRITAESYGPGFGYSIDFEKRRSHCRNTHAKRCLQAIIFANAVAAQKDLISAKVAKGWS